MQVQHRDSITVAGYLQRQRGPASSLQRHLTGKQFVQHRPGTNILQLRNCTLDVAELKGIVVNLIKEFQGDLWTKICPYDYDKCVKDSPLYLYSEDLKIKE